MDAWNTGELAIKQQIALNRPPLTKEESVHEVVQKYRQMQYSNYMWLIGELGNYGYCVIPKSSPEIGEIIPGEMQVPTYGEYRRVFKRGPINDFGDDKFNNNNKKPKIDDGWDDDPSFGMKSESQQNLAKNNRKNNKSTSIQMQTGWSDDEETSRPSDRYNNDRFGRGENRERGGGYRGGSFRGGRGGRGGRFGNRSPRNNSRYSDNMSRSDEKVSSGWSDEESATKKNTADDWNDIKNEKPNKTVDDWDNDNKSSINANNSPLKSQNPTAPVNEDWD